eukprot:m.53368 g.53368  ORF g.53368 m.53368 type:complete len:120 (+) comp12794_c0_seq1:322-681(+)
MLCLLVGTVELALFCFCGLLYTGRNSVSGFELGGHNDVVDGDVNELDKETKESQNGQTKDGCEGCDLVFCSVGALAVVEEDDAALSEVAQRSQQLLDLIHLVAFLFACVTRGKDKEKSK